MAESYDFVIIGTGIGGATLARALAEAGGASILMIERGDFLPQEEENWSPEAVFIHNRYKAKETWRDASGGTFHPGVHYFVGGNSKVFGAVFQRLRAEDFGALEHEGGTSPAWPVTYQDFEPYYSVAERWYRVHGAAGEDPTEPVRSGPFPFPPMPQDDYMADLAGTFQRNGLHPYRLPIGVDLGTGGRCIRCGTCDAFPCRLLAKSDAEACAVRPALTNRGVELMTNTYVRRLVTDASGKRVEGAEIERAGDISIVRGERVIVAAGAVNSAALLLRSANERHPNGLANRSDQVGRNYMVHNNTVLLAIHPTNKNPTVFQKTFALNDFYFGGPGFPYPLGNLQPVGKVRTAMLKSALPKAPSALLGGVAARSTDWWVMSEDLPDPENRVTLSASGEIVVRWKPNNMVTHARLLGEAKRVFREAGYPLLLNRGVGIETNSHQVGTIRFGDDPAASVLDPWGQAHDLENLFVVDASFFPSSSAINPALTIAAQSLRVAHKICGQMPND